MAIANLSDEQHALLRELEDKLHVTLVAHEPTRQKRSAAYATLTPELHEALTELEDRHSVTLVAHERHD